MKDSRNCQDIDERTFNFAVKIVKIVLKLPNNNIATWKIGGQIISSATSVNSNIVQARAGISKKDFINHSRIAFKEASETKRWLEMMVAINLVSKDEVNFLIDENKEIIYILISIIKNSLKKEREV